jgi:hypothetical protein
MLRRRFLCILIAAAVAFECQTAVAENNVLPDSTVFRSWKQPRRYTHTFGYAQLRSRGLTLGMPQGRDLRGSGLRSSRPVGAGRS